MQFIAMAAMAAIALYIVTSLIPNMGILADWSAWQNIGDLFNYGFYFIPLDTFLWCFSVVMVVQNANLVWAGMTWLLRRIPGQG